MSETFRRFDNECVENTHMVADRISLAYNKIWKDHYAGLTDKERLVLVDYSGTGSYSLNKFLRHQFVPGEPIYKKLTENAKTLKGILERKFLPENIILYKGRHAKSFRGSTKKFIQDPAFLSTSLNKYVASQFCRSNSKIKKQLLVLKIPAGTNGFIMNISGECEVVLLPNTKFEILKKSDFEIKEFPYVNKLTKMDLRFVGIDNEI